MQHAVRRTVGIQGLQCSPVRPHALSQCRNDGALHPQPAQAGLLAGDRHQQRCQHAGHGSVGSSGVLRTHHFPLAAGHCLCRLRPAAHFSLSQEAGLSNSSSSIRRRPGTVGYQSRLRAAAAGSAAVAAVTAADPATHRHRSSSLHPPSDWGSRSSQLQFQRSSMMRPLPSAAAASGTSTVTTTGFSAAAAVAVPAAAPAALDQAAATSPLKSSTCSDGSNVGSSAAGDDPATSSSSSSSSSSSTGRLQLDPELGRYSYRLVVSYDGTAYSGWQLQARAPTIQAQMERALSTVLREDRRTLCVCAAGRTDAGVHARGQVVQFMTNSTSIEQDHLPYKLNSLLPRDIRVMWARRTAPDFNVTVSALHKTYHYHMDIGPCHDPLRVRYSHHCRRPLDLAAMRAAAALLVGTHNFTQFSNTSLERLRRNPVKTLQRFDVLQDPANPSVLRLEVQGSGFLYKQVRHMSGALLAAGEGRLELQDILRRLELGSAEPPGAGGAWRGYNIAPAKGLQLFEVQYPAGVDDPHQLLYPNLPHDEHGRLLLRIPGGSSSDE